MAHTRTEANHSGLDNDARLFSTDPSYSTASNGSNVTLERAGVPQGFSFNAIGQSKGGSETAGGDYSLAQFMHKYAYPTTPSGHKVVSASIDMRHNSIAGSVTRSLMHLEYNYGDATDATDWRTRSQLQALDLLAVVPSINNACQSFAAYVGGGTGLVERIISGSSPLGIVTVTNRQLNGTVPTTDERLGVYHADEPEPALRPSLRIQTIPDSHLLRVGGASAQLSDGTAVFVTSDGSSLTLQYSKDNVTDEDIADLPAGDGIHDFDFAVNAWQLITLCVDASDNIFVIGKSGAESNSIVVRSFRRGDDDQDGNPQWSSVPPRTLAMPQYWSVTNSDVPINNLSATWHATSGAGHIMVLGSHRAGSGGSGQIFWATLNVQGIFSGSGNYITQSGVDPAWLTLECTDHTISVRHPNDTGNALDVWGDGLVGYAISLDGTQESIWGYDRAIITFGKYRLNTAGQVTEATPFGHWGTGESVDAESKAKVVPIDDTQVAFCYFGEIYVYSTGGTPLGWSSYKETFSSAGFDPGTTCAVDYVYDPSRNRIWMYYVDKDTDAREIRRNGFVLGTYVWQGLASETVVADDVGDSGDVITGIRIPRGRVNERNIRIDVAKVSSGGTLGTVLVKDDGLNFPPNTPTVNPKSSFDADQSTTFSWNFSDGNTGDYQGAYQVRIYNVDAPTTVVHDSGKTASNVPQYTLPGGTLSNDETYNWEVRVWDSTLSDTNGVSGYSAQSTFTTLSTAVVNITNPASDNPANATTSTYEIGWEIQGGESFTQTHFRVELFRTDTGFRVFDTFYIPGTNTSYELEGLEDGVEYLVRVTAKDNAVVAAAGTRLITPSYAVPDTPVVTLSQGASYILVTVENPTDSNEVLPRSNDLYRGIAGEDTFTRIANIPANGTYRDYAVRSGVRYVYYVRAVV